MMGCSNPHPHGQIWANATVPDEPAKESMAQRDYQAAPTLHACFAIIWNWNAARGERLIAENNHFSRPWCLSGRSGRLKLC
jgi:UDPglucose--hexose-1-phosphate uridylyltransferase